MELDSMTGLVALMSVIMIFCTPVIIVIAILVHRSQRTKRIHETVVKLAEKGLPIPPELFIDKPAEDSRSALSKGVVLVAVGLGLTIFFLTLQDRHAPWGVGMIPLLIGAGYLLVWWLEGRKEQAPAPGPRTNREA
jgi:hypothetical protein